MKKKVYKYLGRSANKLDYYRFRLKQRHGWLGEPRILPFAGFGNHQTVRLRGLVLEDKGGVNSPEHITKWKNAQAILKRYISSEAPRVQVRGIFQGQEKIVQTDSEGYFYMHFNVNYLPPTTNPWSTVKLDLLDKIVPDQGKVSAEGEVLLSGPENNIGIISDIDDTVLVSQATKLRKKLNLMLFKNARTRLPFEGVSAFYQALHEGSSHHQFRPIFYVSSSSWKLYDLLYDFFELQGIPKGPLLLRDSRLDRFKFKASVHKGHKLEQVESIMHAYPQKSFILIGDSGQKDAQIYAEICKLYPNRVLAIYIRDIGNVERHQHIEEIATNLAQQQVPMLLVKNTVEAAQHAYEQGWIDEQGLKMVEGKQKADHKLADLQSA